MQVVVNHRSKIRWLEKTRSETTLFFDQRQLCLINMATIYAVHIICHVEVVDNFNSYPALTFHSSTTVKQIIYYRGGKKTQKLCSNLKVGESHLAL